MGASGSGELGGEVQIRAVARAPSAVGSRRPSAPSPAPGPPPSRCGVDRLNLPDLEVDLPDLDLPDLDLDLPDLEVDLAGRRDLDLDLPDLEVDLPGEEFFFFFYFFPLSLPTAI